MSSPCRCPPSDASFALATPANSQRSADRVPGDKGSINKPRTRGMGKVIRGSYCQGKRRSAYGANRCSLENGLLKRELAGTYVGVELVPTGSVLGEGAEKAAVVFAEWRAIDLT